ncbi:MAG TPA: hypothetical protein VN782_16530 [Usitatibacter sp.]|nr:hypothetical protein [Usitatibacter sp.]
MRARTPFAVTILAAAAALSLHARAEPRPIVCGGIGSEERAALAGQARDADLALELFIAGRGDYVAGANVSVIPLDGAARGETLRETAQGPLCYMKLAPGRYRIEGELNGVTRSARAIVPAHAGHPVRVALAFPEEAVRDGLGPQPTTQEREEAKTP